MNGPRIVGIIPARYASTRLPGKPLKLILGKTMIQRVYLRCRASDVLEEVCVATDDRRIAESVEAVGGRAIMTSPDHVSGTDRLAEAVATISADLVVNIQGDQPFIDPKMIREAVTPLLEDAALDMGTLMHRITREEDLHDPAVVKVVTDRLGFALYFSRSTIPYPRNPPAGAWYEHVGLYVYRREFLLRLAELPPTPLELAESLEQLRVLEHGHRMRVVQTRCLDNAFCGLSIDTPADLARAEVMLRDRGGD